jgi:hypothetical protein
VNNDPSEAYPIHLPKVYLSELMSRKGAFEASFYARSINMSFGFEYELCCNKVSNCTCDTPNPIRPF